MIQELSVIVMLGICSWEDLKSRHIHIWWPACFAIEGILCWLLWWKQPMTEFLAAIFPGAVMLVLAFVTQRSIGEGDGMLLIVMGIFLGAACTARILVYAVFLTSGYALFLYIIRKKSRNYEIPFVPFILMAFVAEILLRE